MDQIPINSYPDEVARMWKQQRDIAIEALKELEIEGLMGCRHDLVVKKALAKINELEIE